MNHTGIKNRRADSEIEDPFRPPCEVSHRSVQATGMEVDYTSDPEHDEHHTKILG
jgi:hypothetical protein